MCGRFQISKIEGDLQIRFHVDVEHEWLRQIFNAAPMMQLPVITSEEPGRLSQLRWGLLPFWAKDPSIAPKLINARAETLVEKPSFKNALKSRRCIIPANAFYEWKREGGEKLPYRISLKDEELFAFAGLWEKWKDPSGEVLQTFTIITTQPNEVVADIHDRMPVILEPESEKLWLDIQVPVSEALSFLKPYDAGKMKKHRVSDKVNSVRNQGAEVAEEVII
ncbi:MAG: SOS response-associated peptidase [Bacteroidales bacterium]